MMVYHYTLIRGRSREGCFRAFRHNNWVGLADLRRHRASYVPVSLDAIPSPNSRLSGAQRGSRLTLYANRLVHQGGDAMETVPLAQLASVRVAFERDPRKLNWAIALLVVALILALVSGPLQAGMLALGRQVATSSRPRIARCRTAARVFSALGRVGPAAGPVALLLAAGAVALLVFFWLGLTTLTLSFAATERVYAVRGRNQLLVQFAETVAEQLAAPLPDPEARRALLRPARFHRPARAPGRTEARRGGGFAAAGDDRDLRPRAAPGRPGAPVRAARRAFDPGARQPVRHGAAHLPGDGRRGHRCAARNRQAACRAARTGAAQGPARCVGDGFRN